MTPVEPATPQCICRRAADSEPFHPIGNKNTLSPTFPLSPLFPSFFSTFFAQCGVRLTTAIVVCYGQKKTHWFVSFRRWSVLLVLLEFDSWSSVYPMSFQNHDIAIGCTDDQLSNSRKTETSRTYFHRAGHPTKLSPYPMGSVPRECVHGACKMAENIHLSFSPHSVLSSFPPKSGNGEWRGTWWNSRGCISFRSWVWVQIEGTNNFRTFRWLA